MNIKLFPIVILSALFISCDNNDNDNKTCDIPDESYVKIYKDDESAQCFDNSGIALEDMQQELTNSGIDVICSQKGNDGIPTIFLCGADSGGINIYLINKSNLGEAEKIGFSPLDGILNNGSK